MSLVERLIVLWRTKNPKAMYRSMDDATTTKAATTSTAAKVSVLLVILVLIAL